MPYFGGKSQIADRIWLHLGDVDSYVEPFCGSMAVLLARPPEHRGTVETVNDADHFLVNFWRALKADPDAVAEHADWIVSEADLTARHIWLVNEGRERIANLEADPDAYDAKVAGWWVWGMCLWIGSGWCSGNGPWTAVDGKLGRTDKPGVRRKLVHLGNPGRGVNRQLVHLGAGRGVNRQLVHLGDPGQGVNRKRVHLGGATGGMPGVLRTTVRDGLYEYLQALADRLRHVRVCCGDWARVVTDGALAYGKTVGVFLDPPYAHDTGRATDLYRNESANISRDVAKWAIEHGNDPRLRIALAGYEGEHDMPADWLCVHWKARAAYRGHDTVDNLNRKRERIWFNKSCVNPPMFREDPLDTATDPVYNGHSDQCDDSEVLF